MRTRRNKENMDDLDIFGLAFSAIPPQQMPRRIRCQLQTEVRRISFAKSCVTKSPEAEKAKTMEEIAPPKTPMQT